MTLRKLGYCLIGGAGSLLLAWSLLLASSDARANPPDENGNHTHGGGGIEEPPIEFGTVASTIATANLWSTSLEQQRKVFRNPRGDGALYAAITEFKFPGENELFVQLHRSTDAGGGSWELASELAGVDSQILDVFLSEDALALRSGSDPACGWRWPWGVWAIFEYHCIHWPVRYG